MRKSGEEIGSQIWRNERTSSGRSLDGEEEEVVVVAAAAVGRLAGGETSETGTGGELMKRRSDQQSATSQHPQPACHILHRLLPKLVTEIENLQ
jgi:hypothetical protein